MMKVYRKLVLCALGIILMIGSALAADFQSFTSESGEATEALDCRNPKITSASFGMGELYGCVQGTAETVKWFINEVPNTGRVDNVKLMWNDWFKDVGYGLHADKQKAEQALKALIQMYAPNKEEEVEEAFWGNSNRTIASDGFVLEYTYSRGPAIDERLIVVTEE
ncbi:hypothetical protein ACTXPD_05235 [Vreelandella alkaliphila]|uniref:hypothetical protein n=1 Tax=Halomonadaceae TaxID=28256 RepID=UPI001D012D57|nr:MULTISPECIES: hypothetical protein [unclassified Halomonas]